MPRSARWYPPPPRRPSAAGANPLLTILVAVVKATDLVDTLNSQPAITAFAPADSAFNALGDAKFTQLAQNPSQLAPSCDTT
jgi:uncharacterized surface protein with fasciclin (FAS1) repeats